jgi:uncharacterized integral membrane protein (TIGR00698 family)
MMAEKQGIDWSSLWKKEEWLAVWIGFLIIIVLLAGVKIKTPNFRWTTDGEFMGVVSTNLPAIDKLMKTAKDKGEAAVVTAMEALKKAVDSKDRKAIGDAAKKLQDAGKGAKDESLKKDVPKLTGDIVTQAGRLSSKVVSADNILWSIYLGIIFLVLSIIAMALMGEKLGLYILGFPVVYIIAWLALFISGNYTIYEYGLEYVLWCLVVGLIISNVIGVPKWLKPAVKTEYYIKIGLVILGSGILFGEIIQAGAYGIVQAVLVVATVWYFCFWLCKKLGVDDEFAAMLSSGVAICGVSAAIATSGAVKGDPKKLSYVTSIVLICAVPMLVLQPLIAKNVGMPDVVAGAWIGGTLDTSGSVVAAGALVSEVAMKVGVIVKMSQNVLIGVAAFILSIIWTFKKAAEVPGGEKPSAMEIWYRFPKFVVGFIVASIVFSFFLPEATVNAVKGTLGGLRTIWFAMAFTCIGLETRFADLLELGGGRPAIAFLAAQGVNIIWTLILAYLIFGGILWGAPKF